MKILKGLLMIITAPVILVLTLFVWLCTGLIYISGLVLGLFSTVIALLGVAVLLTYSPQNGVILLVMAFLISPMAVSYTHLGCGGIPPEADESRPPEQAISSGGPAAQIPVSYTHQMCIRDRLCAMTDEKFAELELYPDFDQ